MNVLRRTHKLLITLCASVVATSAIAGTFFPEKSPTTPFLDIDKLRAKAVNGVVVVGDMLFKVGEVETKAAFRRTPWTNGILVYDFDASVDMSQRNAFVAACNNWTVSTPVTCVQRTTEPNFVRVSTHDGQQCGGPNISCSFVGMIGRAQDLWIFRNHWTSDGLLTHEIGHALGLIHEHQRPDRDAFIYVIGPNIQQGQEDQFAIIDDADGFGDYDFQSIMHYSNCLFSRHPTCSLTTPDLQTIVPRSCDRDAAGGNSITPSDLNGTRSAYAPTLQALLVNNRRSECGVQDMSPGQVVENCGANCAAATPVSWRKVDTLSKDWCGFAPVQYPETWCPPIKKTYKHHWWDTDPLSCGFPPQDLHEIWVECGCPAQTLSASCVDPNTFTQDSLSKPIGDFDDWKSGRVLYFNQIMNELKSGGLLSDVVLNNMGVLYQQNFLDRRFESKLARARAGIFSYARWKRSVDPTYSLDWSMFAKVATFRKLRVPDAPAAKGVIAYSAVAPRRTVQSTMAQSLYQRLRSRPSFPTLMPTYRREK